MATIVIHAGIPKTGSTSIQHWLAANFSRVQRHGFTLLVAPKNDAGEVVLAPYDGKTPVNSGRLVSEAIPESASRQGEIVEAFAEALASAADRYGGVIVSAEAFMSLFRTDGFALPPLQRLSTRHEVRVAYYARPQHTGLEALWRQMGFRSGMQPSVFLGQRIGWLRYALTRQCVRAEAPGLDFEPVPFRRDMLQGGDVVVDFVHRFLGIEAEETPWANPGLPLEVVNLLRVAPTKMFWGEGLGNERLARIKHLLADHPPPEDDRIALSRRVLQSFAHERYAAENAELGWEDFVPPPEDDEELPGLEALDELWQPRASEAERAFLYRALDAAI